MRSGRQTRATSLKSRKKNCHKGGQETDTENTSDRTQECNHVPVTNHGHSTEIRNDDLPPDFRTGGLFANVPISNGKLFGPFKGSFVSSKNSEMYNHTFICQLEDLKNSCKVNFFALDKEKQKCTWLTMIRSSSNSLECNFVAYDSPNGVCYVAVRDIGVGEEILAIFDPDRSTLNEKKRSRKRKNREIIKFTKSSVQELTESSSELNVHCPENNENQGCEDSNIDESSVVVQLPKDMDNCEPAGVCLTNGFIRCGKCCKKFNNVQDFRLHAKLAKCRGKLRTKYPGFAGDMSEKIPTREKTHKALLRCDHCDMMFETSADLSRHFIDAHSQEIDESTEGHFNCLICKSQFTKASMNAHVKLHKAPANQCKKCLENFSSKRNLRKHERTHIPNYMPSKRMTEVIKKNKCDTCGKAFKEMHSLKIHYRVHSGERPYKCSKCARTFTQRGHLSRHVTAVHCGDENVAKKKCIICQRSYSTETALEIHVNTIHKGLRPFKCQKCNDTFTMRGHLLRHEREIHGMQSEVADSEKRYICKRERCGAKFALQSELNKHTAEHTGVLPYQCKECQTNFSNSGNLRKHIRRKHLGQKVDGKKNPSNEKYECVLCNKVYSHPSTLKEHVRAHAGEKVVCPKCGQNFVQRSGLRKHLRCLRCPVLREDVEKRGEEVPCKIYTRKKTWQCPKCDKFFAGPSDLKAHDRIHTGERPYCCKICDKCFTQSGNLRKHEKYVHGGETRPKNKQRDRKYPCSHCGKSFSTPGDLSMHYRVHTGVKPYECTYCGMAFTQKGNLRKHVVRWHTVQGLKGRRQVFDENTLRGRRIANKETEMLDGNIKQTEVFEGESSNYESVNVITGEHTQSVAQGIAISHASLCQTTSTAINGLYSSTANTSSTSDIHRKLTLTAAYPVDVLSTLQSLIGKSTSSQVGDQVELLRHTIPSIGQAFASEKETLHKGNTSILQQAIAKQHLPVVNSNVGADSAAINGELMKQSKTTDLTTREKGNLSSSSPQVIDQTSCFEKWQETSRSSPLSASADNTKCEISCTDLLHKDDDMTIKSKDGTFVEAIDQVALPIETDASGKTYAQLRTRSERCSASNEARNHQYEAAQLAQSADRQIESWPSVNAFDRHGSTSSPGSEGISPSNCNDRMVLKDANADSQRTVFLNLGVHSLASLESLNDNPNRLSEGPLNAFANKDSLPSKDGDVDINPLNLSKGFCIISKQITNS